MTGRFSTINNRLLARIYDGGFWKTALVLLPIGLCIEDSFFSTFRVHGSSMEPALQDGDVVFVRKVDFFPWKDDKPTLSNRNDDANDHETTTNNNNNNNNHHSYDENNNLNRNYDKLDRVNISRMDALTGSRGSKGFLWSRPCQAMKGDIVLYKSPHHFHPQQIHIKRVIGLGGQRVRPADSFRSVKAIHPYSIWVEGDNIISSQYTKDDNRNNHQSMDDDSRTVGPICKKLIVGKAVHIIWPPSRWGSLKRERPPHGRSWWP